jgi:hypothetical protein
MPALDTLAHVEKIARRFRNAQKIPDRMRQHASMRFVAAQSDSSESMPDP